MLHFLLDFLIVHLVKVPLDRDFGCYDPILTILVLNKILRRIKNQRIKKLVLSLVKSIRYAVICGIVAQAAIKSDELLVLRHTLELKDFYFEEGQRRHLPILHIVLPAIN